MTSNEGSLKRVRISKRKLQLLIRCFATDTNASQTTKIVLLNRNTINRYFNFFRDLLVIQQIEERAGIDIFDGIEESEGREGEEQAAKLLSLVF